MKPNKIDYSDPARYGSRHCTYCGAKTILNRLGLHQYSSANGEALYRAEVVCPSKTFGWDYHYRKQYNYSPGGGRTPIIVTAEPYHRWYW